MTAHALVNPRGAWRLLLGSLASIKPLDLMIALGLVVIGMITASLAETDESTRDPDIVAYLLVLLFALPQAIRWQWPLPVLGCCIVGIVVAGLRDYPSLVVDLIASWLAFFAVVTQLPRSQSIAAAAVLGLAALGAMLIANPDGEIVTFLFTTVLLIAVVWLLGDSFRQRRLAIEKLAAQAEELRLTRLELAEQAVNQERLRIARELHDSVAHSLSVVVIQATLAGELLDRDPQASAQAMREVQETGRKGLGDVRHILGVLREPARGEDPALPPNHGAEELQQLYEDIRKAGVELRVTTLGEPLQLPGPVNFAMYRIIQESLTNSLRHSPGSSAEVRLQYDSAFLSIEVTNAPARAEPATGTGPGMGIRGMRERVALMGGDFSAGPLADGGYRVFAKVPIQ